MTRPLSPRNLVHWAARDDFEVFLKLGFSHLNGGQTLAPSWYISAMAHQLDRSYRGECLRLIMTLPPRYLKSTIVSVLLPAWAMGRDPGLRIIVASYGQELADALSREFRRVVTSQWYHEVFPDKAARIVRDTNTETTMTGGGYRYAATVGGTLNAQSRAKVERSNENLGLYRRSVPSFLLGRNSTTVPLLLAYKCFKRSMSGVKATAIPWTKLVTRT